MIEVLSFITVCRFRRISSSVSTSTAERQSSKMRIRGLEMIARAMEMRCFCPPESVTPRSPTTVSKPCGKDIILSYTPASVSYTHLDVYKRQLQDKLGIPTSAGALDYNLGCSGYIYGLALAKGLIAANIAKNILLITSCLLYTSRCV